MLRAAYHVFQKHNGVIDKETNGQGQRHQREVVDGEIEHVHHGHREQ